jgi:hypothetical protein
LPTPRHTLALKRPPDDPAVYCGRRLRCRANVGIVKNSQPGSLSALSRAAAGASTSTSEGMSVRGSCDTRSSPGFGALTLARGALNACGYSGSELPGRVRRQTSRPHRVVRSPQGYSYAVNGRNPRNALITAQHGAPITLQRNRLQETVPLLAILGPRSSPSRRTGWLRRSTGLYDDPYLVGWMTVIVNARPRRRGRRPLGIR